MLYVLPIQSKTTVISQTTNLTPSPPTKHMQKQNSPLGTTHTPPLLILNSLPATSTSTLPSLTKKHICILRAFLVRLTAPAGNSTRPHPKKGVERILA